MTRLAHGRLRLEQRDVTRFAARLALAMLVADLAGRARTLLEIERDTGLRFRGSRAASFEESRGGEADSGMATVAAPVIFADIHPEATEAARTLRGAGGRNRAPLGWPEFAEEGEAQLLTPARLEPKAALDFFRQKTAFTRRAFNKLAKRYRETAFTVANVESVKLIEEIQAELDRALAQGLTRADFEKAVNARFRSLGLQPLDPFHLETVFRTNVASAYAAGRASQMLQPDVRKALPWWEYRTVGDSRVRDEHAALEGFLARWDDPVWAKIYPPNGFNCRCKVRALLDGQARERASKSGQDLDKPGLERMPPDAQIDFDNSPIESLAARAKGRASSQPKPRPTAKEITAKAAKLREAVAERYVKLDEEKKDLEAKLNRADRHRRIFSRQPEVREKAQKDYDELAPKLEAARRAFRELKAEFDGKIHAMVRQPAARQYAVKALSRVDATRRNAWELGLREFSRLVGIGPDSAEISFQAARGSRSHFRAGVVRMTKRNAGPRVVVHELGHWLEHAWPKANAAARRFLERRTAGEAAIPLRKLRPGWGYTASEVAKPDKFLEVYMGKVYRHGSTEIVSMGVEWLYAQPFDLLADEDYFEFIVGLLSGEGL